MLTRTMARGATNAEARLSGMTGARWPCEGERDLIRHRWATCQVSLLNTYCTFAVANSHSIHSLYIFASVSLPSELIALIIGRGEPSPSVSIVSGSAPPPLLVVRQLPPAALYLPLLVFDLEYHALSIADCDRRAAVHVTKGHWRWCELVCARDQYAAVPRALPLTPSDWVSAILSIVTQILLVPDPPITVHNDRVSDTQVRRMVDKHGG